MTTVLNAVEQIQGDIRCDGDLHIAGNLGVVHVASIRVRGALRVGAGTYVVAAASITAGGGIEAAASITAGGSIKAGGSIEAAGSITAGGSIEAGLSVECSAVIRVGFRIFAGMAVWKQSVTGEEKMIRCQRLAGGEVAYGTLVEESAGKR